MADFNLQPCDPAQRDPRSCPVGYYFADSLRCGGAQGFLWFGTNTEALQFLHQRLSGATDGDDVGLLGRVLEMLSKAIQCDSGLSRQGLEAINESQEAFLLRWFGNVTDLLAGQGRFEREIRSDFGSTLPPVLDDAFISHLAYYAEFYPQRHYRLPYKPNLGNWL